MTDLVRLKDEVKNQVRALLISSTRGLTKYELLKDFLSMLGHDLPYRKLGYNSADAFFEDSPDVCSISWRAGEVTLTGVANDKTRHIQKLVSKQKVSKKPTRTRRSQQTPRYSVPVKQSVPVHIQVRIKELLESFPGGILGADFNNLFADRFHCNVRATDIGFASLGDLLFGLPRHVFALEPQPIGGFKLKLRNPPTVFRQRGPVDQHPSSLVGRSAPPSGQTPWKANLPPRLQKAAGQSDASDTVRVTFSQLNTAPAPVRSSETHGLAAPFSGSHSIIDEELKRRIRTLLARTPKGVWAARLPLIYKQEYKQGLDYQELGYSSVIEMMDSIPDVATVERPTSNGDWMLYDSRTKQSVETAAPTPLRARKPSSKPVTSTAPSVGSDVRECLLQVLLTRPDGVLTGDFMKLYQSLVGSELDYHEIGFASLDAFLISISDIVRTKYIGSGRVLILPQDPSLPARTDRLKGLQPKESVCLPAAPATTRNVPPDSVGPGTCYKIQPLPPTLLGGQYMAVYIGHVGDPGNFWVQLKGIDTSEALEVLMDKLEEVYYGPAGDRYAMSDTLIAIGQVCVALYPDDNNWHRAAITGLRGEDFVEVLYVDYGTTCSVPRTALRMLKSKLMMLPAQAIQARLANVKPTSKDGQWTVASRQSLLNLGANRPLVALLTGIQNDMLCLCLCDTSSEIDIHINDTMMAEGHCYLAHDLEAGETDRSRQDSPELGPSSNTTSPDSLPELLEEMTTDKNRTLANSLPDGAGPDSLNESCFSPDGVGSCLPTNIKKIKLPGHPAIHVILYQGQGHMTSAEVSNLIWDTDCLRSKLREHKIDANLEVVSKDKNGDLLREMESAGVDGVLSSDGTLRSYVTLYTLDSILDIVSTFGCKSAEFYEALKVQRDSFDPNDSFWKGDDEDSNYDEEENIEMELNLEEYELLLQAFQFRRQRILRHMPNASAARNVKLVDEVNFVEGQIAKCKAEIDELKRKVKSSASRQKKFSEEEDFMLSCVEQQYKGMKMQAVRPTVNEVRETIVQPSSTPNTSASNESNSGAHPGVTPHSMASPHSAMSPHSTTSLIQPDGVRNRQGSLQPHRNVLAEQQALYQQLMAMSSMAPVVLHQQTHHMPSQYGPMNATAPQPLVFYPTLTPDGRFTGVHDPYSMVMPTFNFHGQGRGRNPNPNN